MTKTTNKKLTNIVITGANQGIGKAIAIRYASANIRLILIARNMERLTRVKETCEQKGAKVVIYSIDVKDTQQLTKQLKEIDQQYPIDKLFCNAGVTSHIGESGEPESWDSIENVIDTNFTAVVATINAVIDSFQKRKHGHIIIISSIAAFRGMPITPIYCASKSAVKAYGEALQGWLSEFNINTTLVFPGFVKSNMSEQFPTSKPFMISTEKAANIIVKGIEKQQATISFPFLLSFGIRFLSILPSGISNRIFKLMSFGASH